MHADQREDIDSADAGDIVAVLGVDCASGDTYASEPKYCALQNMFVPQPVIRMAIAPLTRDGADRLSKALHRFRREDPTLHVTTDEETSETIIAPANARATAASFKAVIFSLRKIAPRMKMKTVFS